MERKKARGAGVRGRRPGSDSGPPSSSCDSPWEGGRETPLGGGDFFSQMDENGIIGLEEVSAGEELEEGSEGGVGLPWDPGALEPADGPPDEDALEDPSYSLSELQDSEPLSQSPGRSLCDYEEDEQRVLMEDWGTEGDEEEDGDGEEGAAGWAIRTQQAEKLPERDRQLDMTDEEREGGDSDTRGRSDLLSLIATEMGGTQGGRDTVSRGGFWASDRSGENSAGPFSAVSPPRDEEDDGKGQSEEGFHTQDPSSDPYPRRRAAGSHPRAVLRPHSRRFSGGRLDPEVGIEGETLPESGFTESLPESHSSRLSQAPPTARPEVEEPFFLPSALMGGAEEEEGVADEGLEEKQESNPRPLPQPRKPPSPSLCRRKTPSMHLSSHKAPTPIPEPSPHSSPDPGVRRSHKAPKVSPPKSSRGCPDSDHDRKGQLNFPLPDFSKVGPRVRIPRGGGYRPPKSRGPSLQGASRVTEPLLVYKSPADIVQEVLMSSGEGPAPRAPPSASPAPTLSVRSHRPIDITMPQEFRSPKQATLLVHQLQEDYNKLLTKYAEAENTIDRLRLEAKVSLYSDPPQPSNSVQSGTVQKSSKVMTLTFPQAQRAQFGKDTAGPDPAERFGSSHTQSSPPRNQGPAAGQQLTEHLAILAAEFQAQLDTFEDLLKRQKLKPFELTKGLASLLQGVDSVERGYLRARDEHRSMQQRGEEPRPFDPDRELEGQIFRLGMRLEELREQVEQAVPDHRGATAHPSPRPTLDPQSGPAGAGGPTPHPESPVSPVRGGFGGPVGAEVSSLSGDSEGEDSGRMEEGLPSGLPPALLRKHSRAERDFNILMDHYQSFRELPGLLAEGTTVADSALLPTASLGHAGIADSAEGRRTDSSIQSERSEEDTVLAPPLEDTLQEPFPQPLPLPGQQGSVIRHSSRKSQSSSLASPRGSTVSERRPSKLHSRRTTAPSQDGLVSPGTDSGFIGSESSHLTPAAGCVSQQGARVSHSAPLEESAETLPNPGCLASDTAHGPPTRRRPLQAHAGDASFSPEVSRSGQESLRGHSLPSPSTSASSSHQPWASSVSCGTEPESERTHSLSGGREGRRVHHTRLTNRLPRQQSPSPVMTHRHGDPLRAHGSKHEAIQSLQAEVTRLKERLEDSIRHPILPNNMRSPPTSPEEAGLPHSIHTNTRLAQYWRNRGREESDGRNKEQEKEVQNRRSDRLRPAPRKRSASVPQRRPELDVSTDSEHAQSVPKAQSSRRIPEVTTSHSAQRQARPEAVVHRGPYTRKLYRLTPRGGNEENEDGNLNGRTRACPNCRKGKGSSAGPTASIHSLPHPRSPQCCPLCHGSGLGVVTEPDGVSAHRGSQPIDSAHKAGGMFTVVAPPPPMQASVPVVPYVPVCPSVLLVSSPALKEPSTSYLQPLYLSLDNSPSLAGVRSKGRDRRHVRSLSADNHALSQSLTRAIEAARGIRAASRSVARCLASGLRQQGVLTQSYLC